MQMKTNPNEPLNCNNGNGYWNDEFNHTHGGVGLTKREHFASLILSGMASHPETINAFSSVAVKQNDSQQTIAAKCAVRYADALIEELNRTAK